MKLYIRLSLLFVFIFCSSAYSVSICENGKAKAVIVVDSACLSSERKAADELSKYLNEITGCVYPVVVDADNNSQAVKIYVGRGEQVDKLMPNFKWELLQQDGIVIKTSGENLILAGGRPRGSLYAVYTFLEDYLECRWWTVEVSSISKKKNVIINDIDYVYVPRLYYRESHYKQSYDVAHPDFAVKLKLNGVFQRTPQEWGGHEFFINGGHSFAQILPAKKYYKEHPEWYSLFDGERSGNGQLCLSNKAMRKEFLKRLLGTIAAHPNYTIVDVSQNDNNRYCHCEACTKLAQKYGGQSGLLLDFVNEIAGEVGKKYPKHLVETMAYTYTEEAPVNIKPADNVVIRLCGIGNDNSKPIDSDSNKKFYNRLKKWSLISKKLFIWDYVANFTNYHIPHANTQVLGKNIKLFMDAGAIGFFEQGDRYNTNVAFCEMRNWVLAKLLWNPSLDSETLIRTFLEGYYGLAWEKMHQILGVYSEALLREGDRLSCYNPANPYLKAKDYIKAFTIFNLAGKEVRPEIRDRIAVQRRSLELSLLLSDQIVKNEVFKSGAVKIDDVGEWCDSYLSWAEKTDNRYIAERRLLSIQFFINKGLFPDHARSGKFPERCLPLKHEDWFDIQNGGFVLLGSANQAFRVDDAKASNGKAVRMPCNHEDWATNLCLAPMIENGIVEGEIFVSVRKESPNSPDGFSAGIFDHATWNGVASKDYSNAKLSSTRYIDFSLGVHKLSKNFWMWVAPVNHGSTDSIYVDRVYIVRKDCKPQKTLKVE